MVEKFTNRIAVDSLNGAVYLVNGFMRTIRQIESPPVSRCAAIAYEFLD